MVVHRPTQRFATAGNQNRKSIPTRYLPYVSIQQVTIRNMTTLICRVLSILLIVVALSGCDNNDTSLPDCVKEMQISSDPPIEIWEWRYPNKTYYYLVSPCCDQYNPLFSEDCEFVCAPDGGLSGTGDGTCPDLSGEVTKRLLWKKNSD